ncbi:MAG: hypothetical protein K0S65_6451, partial [Labilithrix sp.]|nr:hypothetical protein [Labilithrix sp.]
MMLQTLTRFAFPLIALAALGTME